MTGNRWYDNDILVGLALIVLFFIGFLSLDLFVFKRPPIVVNTSPTPEISPTPTPEPSVMPSEYPDYDSLSKLQSLIITKDFTSWTPNPPYADNAKSITTLIVEKGNISKGYIYVRASLNGDNPSPLTQWESMYLKMNNNGGHLFRPLSLKVPPSNKTELLYSLNNVPYVTYPYKEDKTPTIANWFTYFKDKKQIRVDAFISSRSPAKIEEIILYYNCVEGEPCEIKIK